MNRDEAIYRARKFLTLTRINTSTNEANVAKTRLNEIMRQWNLSESDLERILPSQLGEWNAPGLFNESWRLSLLVIACEIYGCRSVRVMELEPDKVLKDQNNEVWYGKIIGTRADADAVIYAFNYYEREALTLCKKYGYDGVLAAGDDSFIRGIQHGIYERVRDEVKIRIPPIKKSSPWASTKTKAVVSTEDRSQKADKFIDVKYPQRKKGGSKREADYDTFYKGKDCSRTIALISPDVTEVSKLIENELSVAS